MSVQETNLLSLREMLITYLTVKATVEDWHGVCDAANDLREVDAELRGLRAKETP